MLLGLSMAFSHFNLLKIRVLLCVGNKFLLEPDCLWLLLQRKTRKAFRDSLWRRRSTRNRASFAHQATQLCVGFCVVAACARAFCTPCPAAKAEAQGDNETEAHRQILEILVTVAT